MMSENIELKESFPVSPEVMYNAWLSSEEHTNMTGGGAICTDKVGDDFTAWDGYISGKNKSLDPSAEIIQAWRTTEFKGTDPDSELVIKIQKTEEGCQVTLIHTNIPKGQSDYAKGWIDHYFTPMKVYFEGK